MKKPTRSNSYRDQSRPWPHLYGHHYGLHRRFVQSPRAQLSEEQIYNFYAAHVTGLKANDKGYAWGHCPFHADHSPSFSVNLRTGYYECKSTSCGAAGHDFVSFVGRLYGLSYMDSIEYVESRK